MIYYCQVQDLTNNKTIHLYWDGENEDSIRPETGDERHDRLRLERGE